MTPLLSLGAGIREPVIDFFEGLTFFQPTFYCCSVNTKMSRPLQEIHRRAFVDDAVISGYVVGLFVSGLPFTVRRLIITVVVDAS